jgi:hypothetical protein
VRRAYPGLGEAQVKGAVAPVTSHLIGDGRGQDRCIRDDRHLDVVQALRVPAQVPAGVAGDVSLVIEHFAPESSPLQVRVHEQA